MRVRVSMRIRKWEMRSDYVHRKSRETIDDLGSVMCDGG